MTRILPFFACFLVGCGAAGRPTTGFTHTTPDLDLPVGHFSFTERSGKTITDQDLRGNVWVASFVFTRCMGPCPAVTKSVARLQTDLKDVPGVKFVTFTVDPNHDDTSQLRQYAEHYKADPERWLFLTGDEATIHKLMKEQFKQAIEKKTGQDVKPGDEFGHSTRLMLVDKKGMIRATYSGIADPEFPEEFEGSLKRLEDRARELAKQ